MGSRTTLTAVAVGVCILGGVGLLGLLVDEDERPSAVPPVAPGRARQGATDRILRELLVEVRALRADLAGQSARSLAAVAARAERAPSARTEGLGEAGAARPSAPPPPAAMPDAPATELASAVGRLEQAIVTLGGGAPVPPIQLPPPGRGFVPLPSYEEFTVDESGGSAFWRAHRFWTCQQVLDRYGPPDAVNGGGGGTVWFYRTSDGYILSLQFADGMLISAYY